MTRKHPQVICFGEALIDRLGDPGKNPEIDNSYEDFFGGAPANVAFGLSKLGIKTAFIGKLGVDLIGKRFFKFFKDNQICVRGIQLDQSFATRIVLVERDEKGERNFAGFVSENKDDVFADEAINLPFIQKVWPEIANNADWFICGTNSFSSQISKESINWCLKEAVNMNIKIALDVNWRAVFWDKNFSPERGPSEKIIETIEPLFENASLIKFSREEAYWFFNNDDPKKISDLFPKAPNVIITDASNPIKWIFNNQQGETFIKDDIKVIDTTGAGDAFLAGLICKIIDYESNKIKPLNYSEIVEFASACGAFVCRSKGAIDSQPSKDDLINYFNFNR